MLDFNTLADFSRTHCTSICAFLVPANLLATLLTVILAVLARPASRVWLAAGGANLLALAMLLHIYTWFSIGVVMAPTYILLALAIACLLSNAGAIVFNIYFSARKIRTKLTDNPI